MINITDLSHLKITRVRPWSICFDYDDKNYLIHGSSELGEGEWQELYERALDANGKYKLTHIINCAYAKERVADDYIKQQQGHTIVYRNIDKEYFAYKLTKRGFATGILESKVQEEERHIERVQKQIKEYEEKIQQLRHEIRDLR